MPEGTCDVWADVDFGHGSVEVRCTRIGAHDVHICNVVLNARKPKQKPRLEHNRRNVFEGTSNE